MPTSWAPSGPPPPPRTKATRTASAAGMADAVPREAVRQPRGPAAVWKNPRPMATRLYDLFPRVREDLRYEPTESACARCSATRSSPTAPTPSSSGSPAACCRPTPCPGGPPRGAGSELRTAAGGRRRCPAPPRRAPVRPALHARRGARRRVGGGRARARVQAGDPDLAGQVVLDFHAFDTWYEEDDPIFAHPRDPFHRVDVLPSSRHVRVELDGELLAESTRPRDRVRDRPAAALLPPPRGRRRELRPTDKRTLCAYKGEASYLVGRGEQRDDLPGATSSPAGQADADHRPRRVLQREGRHHRRRPAPREPQSALAATIVEEAGV